MDIASRAQDMVDAAGGDTAALERLNAHYGRAFSVDDLRAEVWRRAYSYRQRGGGLLLDEAKLLLAQDAGFGNWEAYIDGLAAPVEAFEVREERMAPRRQPSPSEWDALIGVMKERRLTGLEANGLMTDPVLARIAALDHVTSLSLGGSRELTDEGLLMLAGMPQLESLNVSGAKITDRGLEVLRQLPNLRRFEMTWQKGITDRGAANLRFCERLESVNLMGSPTGDGAIEALRGKPALSQFNSGRLVTDAGLALLRELPRLTRLLIDGPFSDEGLGLVAGLAGISELDLFWNVDRVTADGIGRLAALPNLVAFGCDGKLSDDAAMAHYARMPRLRKLRAQEAAATDAGFEALSRSQTLEQFWGRECAGFGNRGFLAFSQMPSLRSLGVGCGNVDDAVLSSFPDFPALRELTPIGVKDDGFRHIGKCRQLERLLCMYCRDTTDAATGHVRGLALQYYYAGLTGITDRSLEILGRMESLEQVDLYECKGVTDAGLAHLAALPRLREVHFDGLPGVTPGGTRVFPPGVKVYYST